MPTNGPAPVIFSSRDHILALAQLLTPLSLDLQIRKLDQVDGFPTYFTSAHSKKYVFSYNVVYM